VNYRSDFYYDDSTINIVRIIITIFKIILLLLLLPINIAVLRCFLLGGITILVKLVNGALQFLAATYMERPAI